MKHSIQIIFIGSMLLLLALPVVFFNPKQTISEKENRTLAKKPALLQENHMNPVLFSEYDAYLQDHLGFRDMLISLNLHNPLKIEKSTTLSRAIAGKEGWYFYTSPTDGNNLRDFYKKNLLDEAQLVAFSEKVAAVANWCASQGIPCIFLICPNKHSVYAEYYPFDRPEGITRADQLTAALTDAGVPYLFPRDFLIAKKADFDFPLYYETDTHWNSQGAYLASTLLQEKIEAIFPTITFPHISYTTELESSMTYGDILPMLGIKTAKSTQPKLTPAGQKNTDFYTYLKNEERNGVHTKGADKNLPRALIYRDSFFTALEPFVSPFFSEAEYHWKNFENSDKEYVLQYKPDIIIFECVERYAEFIVE